MVNPSFLANTLNMNPKNLSICVLGLGEIGSSALDYIRDKQLNVFGYDINPEVVQKTKEKGILAFSEWNDVPDANIYIICVATWNKNGEPDLTPVFDVSKKIAQKANNGILVSIESTIVPGTSRKVHSSILKGVELVHVPHRFWNEAPVEHGVRQLRVIGSVDAESMESGRIFYGDILGIPLSETASIEIAEICKVSENAYRYVQIAFAEELRMICEDLGLNFQEVRKACNTKWNVEILDARDGIGGKCLPKDRRNLASLSKYNTLLTASKTVDTLYREWLKKK
ncbi:MAG: hypothetical protein JXA91_08250 [Candidatus Thermoplasmatota archaeon]|nr:hypothetical protein [Candidatus Thermoplasmatota archaeon]